MRIVRAVWPVVFLIPLSWWADRGCWVAGVDPLYHATLWTHERLGWFVAALAAVSAGVVLGKIVMARRRLVALESLAQAPPQRLVRALERAAREFDVAVPRVVYLDVAAPLAATVVGRRVLLSRGSVAALDDADLELVARHEVAHVRAGDALAGVAWHLAFAALLIPGFEPLERRLHARRERSANLAAAKGSERRYVSLVARIAAAPTVCTDARLGLGATVRRPGDGWLMWIAPAVVLCLAIALPLSHLAFRHDEAYLVAHHC